MNWYFLSINNRVHFTVCVVYRYFEDDINLNQYNEGKTHTQTIVLKLNFLFFCKKCSVEYMWLQQSVTGGQTDRWIDEQADRRTTKLSRCGTLFRWRHTNYQTKCMFMGGGGCNQKITVLLQHLFTHTHTRFERVHLKMSQISNQSKTQCVTLVIILFAYANASFVDFWSIFYCKQHLQKSLIINMIDLPQLGFYGCLRDLQHRRRNLNIQSPEMTTVTHVAVTKG